MYPEMTASGADGNQAIKDLWSKMLADPNFKLSWTVDTADVSKDLGYTRGTFSGSAGNQPMSGSYTTVWKKDKAGKVESSGGHRRAGFRTIARCAAT